LYARPSHLRDRPAIRPPLFFNHPATTEIYTLSLHDALPICHQRLFGDLARTPTPESKDRLEVVSPNPAADAERILRDFAGFGETDRKSTRLNSSHSQISYAVFCLKKKNVPQATF